MALKHMIAFQIAGVFHPSLLKAFNTANQAIGATSNELNELNLRASKVGQLVKLRNEVSNSGKELVVKKIALDSLNASIAKTANPTRATTRLQKRLTYEYQKSKKEVDKQREAVRKLNEELGVSKTRTEDLVKQQHELAKTAAKVSRNLRTKQARATFAERREEAASAVASFTGLAATVFGTIGKPVMAAMSFESQQAELGKYSEQANEVVNLNKNLMATYAKSHEEIVGLQSAAMQGGVVKPNDIQAIKKYTETAIQGMTALDMSPEQFGESYAVLRNQITGTNEATDETLDIMNAASNKFAVYGRDIMDVMARSGGAVAAMTKMDYKQITALSTAFRLVSVSSENAATAQSNFISTLTKGETATKAQQEAFERLGIDSVKLAQMMNRSPEYAQKAIFDVLSRLKSLKEHERGALIGQLFGNEISNKKAILTFINNMDLLKDPFDLIANRSNYAGSMLAEYSRQADTTANAMKLAGNAIEIISAGLGQALLPVLKPTLLAFVRMGATVSQFIENWPVLTSIVTYSAGAFLSLATVIGVVKIAAAVLRMTFAGLSLAMGATPIGLIAAGLSLLVGAGVALYQNWDTVKEKAAELWAWISDIFGKIGDAIAGAWEKAKAFFGFGLKSTTVEVMTKQGNATATLPAMANGGIVTGPTLALVGEGRESEAVLPLSKLGSMLGNRSSNSNVVVNLSVNVSGSSQDAYADVKRGISEGSSNLKRELERLLADQRRLSFV